MECCLQVLTESFGPCTQELTTAMVISTNLHKIQPVSIPTWMKEGVHETLPLAGELFAFNSWLLGKGSHFSSKVESWVDCPSNKLPPHSCTRGKPFGAQGAVKKERT